MQVKEGVPELVFTDRVVGMLIHLFPSKVVRVSRGLVDLEVSIAPSQSGSIEVSIFLRIFCIVETFLG